MTSRRQPSEPAVMAAIEAGCRTLRLPTIRDRFSEIAAAAEREQLTYLGFLAELVMAECQAPGFVETVLVGFCFDQDRVGLVV